jgi:oligopeptide transport system permease protein
LRVGGASCLSCGYETWQFGLPIAVLGGVGDVSLAAAVTLTGSFVVEKVFVVPGLGQHFVNSVLNRDRTLILGVVMVYSVFLLLFNLVVDVAYAWIDPRIDITAEGN